MSTRSEDSPLDVEVMTAGQLERRERLTRTVIELLADMAPDHIQIKDVSERSGVALGTLYRYFPAKQHLLAAAMAQWSDQDSSKYSFRADIRSSDADENSVCDRVLALHRRDMKAFRRNPNFARLDIELHTSSDQFVIDMLDRRAAAHRRVLFDVMDGVPAEVSRVTSIAVGGTMLTALALWTSGRISFAEALRNVEDVICLILADCSKNRI